MSKYALITGASSGIGRSLANEFIKDSYNLVIIGEDEQKLAQTSNQLKNISPHNEIITLRCDLTKEDSPQRIFDTLKSKRIEIDALVNNAGVGHKGKFAEAPIERDLNILRLNMEAVVRLTKLFLPEMISRGGCKILNVGSIAGFQPGPLLAVYHASKAFIVSFSEALAEEVKDSDITVTCLCPGATNTSFFARANMRDTRIFQSGMLMDPDMVAAGGYKAFKSGDHIYIPGFSNKMLTFMRRFIPKSSQAKLNKKFYESPAH